MPSMTVFHRLRAWGADPFPAPFIARAVGGRPEEDGQLTGTHYLKMAIEQDRADVLRAAVAAGVDLRRVIALSGSPLPSLAFAAGYCKLECVRYLLHEYRADVNEEFETGFGGGKMTALDCTGTLVPGGGDPRSIAEIDLMLRAEGGKFHHELSSSADG